MQTNIYTQKENGDLRLIAEVEGLDDPALAVDALLDDNPRLKQREFAVISLDNMMIVEAGEEVVQPRRKITIRGGNSSAPAAPKRRGRKPKEPVEEADNGGDAEESAKDAPTRTRGRPRRNSTARSGKKASPFKSNPKSAD